MSLSTKERQQKRAQGQTLQVSLQLGKAGLNDALVEELRAQLKQRKLVKVRLLPSATEGDTDDRAQAEALAAAAEAELVEVRGHTALLWRG